MIQQSVKSVVKSGNGALRNGHDRRGHIQEYCRSLLHRCPGPAKERSTRLRTLGITSCRHGEGVSTIAASLAAAAASWGDYRILLADANVAEPSAHERFGVPLYPGWANIHKDGDDLAKHIQPTSIFNLSVLAAGIRDEQNTSAAIALGSPGLVKELADGFDLAVFDLPPHGKFQRCGAFGGIARRRGVGSRGGSEPSRRCSPGMRTIDAIRRTPVGSRAEQIPAVRTRMAGSSVVDCNNMMIGL